MSKILVIDDDVDICSLLKRFLTKKGFEVTTAHSGLTGRAELKRSIPDLVLCDFRLPDVDGLEMIQEIKRTSPAIQVIIITGYSDVKMAVNAIKRGAFEYVTKPIHPEEILATINEAIKHSSASTQKDDAEKSVRVVARKIDRSAVVENYIKGSGAQAKRINQLIELVAPTNMTVVILGESGTGKEVTAERIHLNSKRKNKPFIAIDCGAIPTEIASSELFGHKKGSFTGALMDKVGHFEAANGGTLFLDEIGNLSYENQIKFLRVLQERKVKRMGENEEVPVDVRIIVATNENLKDMVNKGTFREDLYYRINEFKIELPSLRERKGDIKEFSEFLLKKSARDLEKEVTDFEEDVHSCFNNYFWPGNLRELKNVIKRATLMATTSKITLDCLPTDLIHPDYSMAQLQEDGEDNIGTDLKSIVEHAERKAILNVLNKTGFNKSKASKILGVDRKTLYNKINAYNIDLP